MYTYIRKETFVIEMAIFSENAPTCVHKQQYSNYKTALILDLNSHCTITELQSDSWIFAGDIQI